MAHLGSYSALKRSAQEQNASELLCTVTFRLAMLSEQASIISKVEQTVKIHGVNTADALHIIATKFN